MIVAHADWGVAEHKRWIAVARHDRHGRWFATAPRRFESIDAHRPAVLGVDFPLGVPRAWARAAGVERFRDLLDAAGTATWGAFFDVADEPGDVSLHRPFFPHTCRTKGAKTRAQLARGLGMPFDDLYRECERAQPHRRAACPLFWTCGANQVGKGALAGWRLLRETDVVLWPFDGTFAELVADGRPVVAEAYPAEFAWHLGLGRVGGKRDRDVRRRHAPRLRDAAGELGVVLDAELRDAIDDGFGPRPDGEDAFDAVLGLLGTLAVVDGRRPDGCPEDSVIRDVEGWILGQGRGENVPRWNVEAPRS